jgi:hypothetical protein
MVARASIGIGDRVTVKVREEAGRSGVFIEPGQVGIVGAIRVPKVYHTTGTPTEFLCVDFWNGDEKPYAPTGTIWSQRARPDYDNIRKLPADTPVTNLPEGELERFCGAWMVTKGGTQ